MKKCRLSNPTLTIKKKDVFLVVLFFILYILISQPGILKYITLSGAILFSLILKGKINLNHYIVMIHAVFYSLYGLLLAFVNMTVDFESVKQLLIYICPGLFSICFFSLYGKKNGIKLLDIQFVALCMAYSCLFADKIDYSNFSNESQLYGYIFGAFALLYFWQKRYWWMVIAIAFMFIENKRIVEFAFVVIMFLSFLIGKIKKDGQLVFVNKILSALLLIGPFIWMYLCSSGVLEWIFQVLDINSQGRIDGESIWTQAKQYYDFSPFYLGRGIGWVISWLKMAGSSFFPILHNDFLAGFIELGFLGYIVWIFLFQAIPFIWRKKIYISNIVLLLTGYMFINFLTDNTYIYVTWLLPFYSILLVILYGEDREKCFAMYYNRRKDK